MSITNKISPAVLFAGGVGGVAPSLFHLSMNLMYGGGMPGYPFFIAHLILFVLGALVSYLFDETNKVKAFFLGMSLPTIFASVLSEPYFPKSVTDFAPSRNHSQTFLGISLAFANDGLPNDHRIDNIEIYLKEGSCDGCVIHFYDENGEPLEWARFGTDKKFSISVPDKASGFSIFGTDINPAYQSLESGGNRYKFDYHYNFYNELFRGLGVYHLRRNDGRISPYSRSPELGRVDELS